MRQAAQQLITAILENDRLGDHRAEPGHAIAQPFGYATAVERQIGAAGASPHQRAPVVATGVAASGWDLICPPAPNSGSSSPASAGA